MLRNPMRASSIVLTAFELDTGVVSTDTDELHQDPNPYSVTERLSKVVANNKVRFRSKNGNALPDIGEMTS